MTSRTRVYNLAGVPADPWAIDDITGLDGLSRPVVEASLNGSEVPASMYGLPSQWSEGYTKEELVSILGRKTKAEIEPVIGIRIRTKKKFLEELAGNSTKEEIADFLEMITPTMTAPVFEVGPDTGLLAELTEGLDYTTDVHGQTRVGDIGSFEKGPFPYVTRALTEARKIINGVDYTSKYLRTLSIEYEGPVAWYLSATFWEDQSDRVRRGKKRKK